MTAVIRTVARVATAQRSRKWGGFVHVISPGEKEFDPFLFLVHHIHSFGPDENAGFPPHPHRGFETVTYILDGAFDHGDSAGNHGTYGAGDVQWMTAGRGVLHSEMFVTHPTQPTTFECFQLWVNLPQRLKMSEPGYQMLWAKDIPEAVSGDAGQQVRVKIIAGQVGDLKANVSKSTPMSVLHIRMDPGTQFEQPVPQGHTCLVYALKGEGECGAGDKSQGITAHQYAMCADDGDHIQLKNTGTRLFDVLLLEGKPFKEPIAHSGPFVMNTPDELEQAHKDYYFGKFGSLNQEYRPPERHHLLDSL